MQHPPAASHGANRVGTEHAPHTDEDRIATSVAEVLDADAPGELPAAHDAARVVGQRRENSPLLRAQMRQGVRGI